MELNKSYRIYSEEEDHPRSLLSRICSCLFLYTVGSCRYFASSFLSREDKVELRSLWKSQDDAYTTEDHWKKKTRKADCLMRKRIRHHFQDHIRKWKDSERPQFPWKMILHFILVIVVTIQVRISCLPIRTYLWLYSKLEYIITHCNSLCVLHGPPTHPL